MARIPTIIVALLLCALAACSDDASMAPSSQATIFDAQLLPSNEFPPVTNADATASGTLVLTLNVTRDAAQNVTAATGDFQVTLAGFPAGTTLTGAHIHPGRAGSNGGIIVQLGVAEGDIVLTNGSGSFSKNGINVPAETAQNMISDAAGFYFNVHTQLNRSGAVRGQMVRR